jgi:2-deoxy-D-gluconate 3-dehydrogenase
MSIASLFDLSGRHAVVTGAASGLGLGIATGLARAGARVVLIDRVSDMTEQVNIVSAFGVDAQAITVDLSDRSALAIAATQALALLDERVDILVNNAGMQIRSPFLEHAVTDWDALLELNLTSGFLLTQQFARGMVARRQGKIINLASIRSVAGSHGAVAYGVSKGGVAQLTRSLSNELAPLGVQVNAIAPGYMDTALTSAMTANPAVREAVLGRVPSGRWGTPDDLQGVAVFLASSASDYVSGAIIPCDGGFLAA